MLNNLSINDNDIIAEKKNRLKIAPEIAEEIRAWSPERLKVMKTLAVHVSGLQDTLPTSDKGFALAYIDAQIVQQYLCTQLTDIDTLDPDSPHFQYLFNHAVVPINYLDGYSVVTTTGLPFWEKLEGETIECYHLFRNYRDQIDTIGSRSFARTASLAALPGAVVTTIAKVYHWQQRVKCYDCYREIELEARKQILILEMMGKHQKAASELFEMSVEYLKDNIDNLNPKVANEILKTAVELERLSLGLEPNKNTTGRGEGGGGEPSHTVIQNYQINRANSEETQNRGVVVSEDNIDKLQQIIDVLSVAGVLENNTQPLIQTQDPSHDLLHANEPLNVEALGYNNSVLTPGTSEKRW
jgi:hypothetical protein